MVPSKSNRLKKFLNIIFLLASGRSTKIAASGSKIRIRIHQLEAVFAAIPTVSTVLLTTVGNAGDV